MKPVLLEFCGINSFSERAEIDFRKLLEFGIFGIFGDTGSGKSTILDCICFALYGDVTRLNSRTAGLADFINYKCDKAYVHFTFELSAEGKRKTYRVEREIKRKGSSSHNVKVYECGKDGTLTAVAEGVRDGKIFLENLIGLEQSDFEKCIALPQGEFAQFVKSTPSERLRIVSRLFNLERYGIALSRRANEKFAAAKKEADIAEAKLGYFAEVSEERNAALKEEIAKLEKENAKFQAELTRLREEERKLTAAMEKRKEAEQLKIRLAQLNAQKAETDALEGELSRLDGAAAVVSAEKEQKAAQEATERARGVYVQARQRAEAASKELEAAKSWNAEQADAEITRLTELRARAQSAQENSERVKKLEQRLLTARRDFAAENELFRDYSYDKEREAIEKRLAMLGEGDFTAFSEEHGKAALLRQEYAQFAEELKALTQKHAQIQPDTDPLIAKYSAWSEGEKTDFKALRAEFEAREKQKEEERQNLLNLEKYQARYKLHCERLQQLQTEGVRVKEELEALQKQTGENVPPLATVERTLVEIKREKAKKQEILELAREKFSKANEELAAATERGSNLKDTLSAAQARLENALKAGKFTSALEAVALAEKYGDAKAARARVK
ncbi:MAG: SMC family ATPase, partial [Clostridiales bacterium]|nr:SMC family ATPase [Clostridiales bacterium]